jgi:uncharacterized protein affecting Mg2+/Co2+ transport
VCTVVDSSIIKNIKFTSSSSAIKWRYSIRFENLGNDPITVRERNWRVFSQSGTLETFRGNGVVGVEPCLNRDNPVFQYSSFVSLGSGSGHMWYVEAIFVFCFFDVLK